MYPMNSYGSYLIRESESRQGRYALSVRDKDRVRHYKIHQSEKFGREFFITARAKFETLQDLVTYYQQDADGLCVNLKSPCVVAADVETDRSHIKFVRKLMSGEFTEVWEGIWNDTTPVAVKTLIPNQNITVGEFFSSAKLMKKLMHPNLVHLYALCSKEEPVFIITELMKHGSLLEYLCGEGKSLKHPQLIDIAAQVATGMAYLEKQDVIHCNLKARNIQVGEGMLCKVANFELARQVIVEANVPRTWENFAMKWAAPESALFSRFSTKSDVWSFGVILYEIITYGRPPYPGMTNGEVLDKTEQGYRMPQPPGCPEKLYDMMLKCWRKDPKDRPTFITLQRKLTSDIFTGDRAKAS